MQKQMTIILLAIILMVTLVNQEANGEFPICTQVVTPRAPSIDGNIVVWQDERSGNQDVYGYYIDTDTEFRRVNIIWFLHLGILCIPCFSRLSMSRVSQYFTM
jgi:beta propeller repeat protein